MTSRKTRNERLLVLLLVSLFLAMPLVTIVYQAVAGLSRDIRLSSKEQAGIAYNDVLLDVIIDIQNLRLRDGPEQRKSLHETLSRMEDVDAAPGTAQPLLPAWDALRQHIDILTGRPEGIDAAHASDIILNLRQMMDDVSDFTNITIDRELDTSYLSNIIVSAMPNIAVTSGRLAVALLDDDRIRAPAFLVTLDADDDAVFQALKRAQRTDKESSRFAAEYEESVRPLLARLRAAAGNAARGRADAGEIVAAQAGFLRALDALNDGVTREFIDRLGEHISENKLKKRLVAGSSAVTLAGFVMLFAFLYKSLLRTERAERAAIAANQAKSEFLANMSHELRTPLNSILGMLRLLMESERLGEEQQELAGVAFQSSTSLLSTVNDILDISKIEAGEMKLENIGFDPQYVLHSVVHAMDHLAREKRVPIIRHYEKAAFPYLIGDPMRLTSVLTNLVGNAVKYTAAGHIDIFARCTPAGEGKIDLVIEIADTGIGIPSDKRADIFDKFVQGDASTTRRYGGTGLGLAITRQVVGMMGGAIGVESEIGLGSTFRVVIPFRTTDRLSEEQYTHRRHRASGTLPPEQARVLIAEDHPMNQMFILRTLEKFGVGHIEITANGLEALEACKKGGWDVILMDCHMPEKNGYETAREIRTLEKRVGGHIPIVAMTANAMVGDREKCLRYGMDEYVSKPINIDILKDVLGQWLSFPDGKTASAAAVSAAPAATVDLSRLRAFTEGNPEAEHELIELFVWQSDRNLATLEATRNGANPEAWRNAAHMLKGGAAGIGADILAGLCEKGQRFDGAAEERHALFGQIGAEYARVKACLRDIDRSAQDISRA